MEIIKIKLAEVLLPPQDDLEKLFVNFPDQLFEEDIVVISSKVIAIAEGRCIPIVNSHKDELISQKDKLIYQEAEYFIPREEHPHGVVITTVIKNTLIASAGIDESNGNGYFIFWPSNPMKSARDIYFLLKKKYNLKKLGVIVSDSHCSPMRSGVIGLGIGFYGFKPTYDYCGKLDIFGRPFRYSKTNIVDSIAAMANLFMGEGNERVPAVVVRNISSLYDKMVFCDSADETFWIKREEDMFYPFFKNMKRADQVLIFIKILSINFEKFIKFILKPPVYAGGSS